jgi:hypothetical protein
MRGERGSEKNLGRYLGHVGFRMPEGLEIGKLII